MKIGNGTKTAFVFVVFSFFLVGLAVFLVDFLFIPEREIPFLLVVLMSFFAVLFLSPLFFWVGLKRDQSRIEASALLDIELNERDIREAVSNWIHIHYAKKLEGELEFYKDDAGLMNCKASVRDES